MAILPHGPSSSLQPAECPVLSVCLSHRYFVCLSEEKGRAAEGQKKRRRRGEEGEERK